MPCSSAQQHTAAQRLLSRAKRCALPCSAMLRALLYFFTYMPIIFGSIIPRSGTNNTTPGLYICCYWTTNNALPAQFSTAICSSAAQRSAAQRSAAQRSAAPCLALRFAVLRRAALWVLFNIRQQLLVVVVEPGMIQIPGSCTCFVYSSFCFLQMIVLSRSRCAPPPPANIARTAVQNVTSSIQHSPGQLALHKHLLTLLSIRYSHQIITGLFFLPHLFTCFSY